MDSPVCADIRNRTAIPASRANVEDRLSGAEVQIILFYLQNALFAFFILSFCFLKFVHPSRAKFTRLQNRSLFMLLVTHLGASFASVAGSWYQAHTLETGVPCWAYLSAYFLMVPCLAFPIVTRLLRFYREDQWTTVVVYASTTVVNMHNEDETRSVANSEQTQSSSVASVTQMILAFLHAFFICCDLRAARARLRMTSASPIGPSQPSAINPDEQTPGANVKKEKYGKKEEVLVLRFLKSQIGAYLTLSVLLFPYIVTVLVILSRSSYVANGCYGCIASRNEENVLIIESVFALLLLVAVYRINLGKQDPFGHVQEIRLLIWLGGLPAVVFLILHSALKSQFKGDFQWTMMIEISLIIYCFIQSGLQCILVLMENRKDGNTMHNVEYSVSEFEEGFLQKKAAYHESFGKYVASEHGYESIAFLESVYQWEEQYFDLGAKTAKARAKKIANMYVGDQAELPCNLPANCVRMILNQLQKEDAAEIKFDFFGQAKSEIVKMLYRDSFRRYLRSKEFKLLSVNMVSALSSALPAST